MSDVSDDARSVRPLASDVIDVAWDCLFWIWARKICESCQATKQGKNSC